MASAFTHAFAAIAGGKIFSGEKMPARFWVLSILCSVLPDFDAIGFRLGIAYESFWGHRGFTHSLLFALIVALLVVLTFFRSEAADSRRWWKLVLFFFLVTSSHALLDMLTNGGHGVALFAPFDNSRIFFPWSPIKVSPIGVSSFFSERGVRVIVSEMLYVWLPLVVVAAIVGVARKAAKGREERKG
ncbi:MAG: metal-dependent hydrolase [Candidatus Kapaibacterium sp.]